MNIWKTIVLERLLAYCTKIEQTENLLYQLLKADTHSTNPLGGKTKFVLASFEKAQQIENGQQAPVALFLVHEKIKEKSCVWFRLK